MARARLLVVDDDPEAREMMTEFFRGYGFEVESAPDGARALDHVRGSQARFSCIVIDLLMPRMSGTDLLRALRDESAAVARIPVVVVTAFPNDFLALKVPVFEKPVNLLQLLLKVEHLIKDVR